MSKDWLEIIELFDKHSVKYIVVGAIAMIKYGYIRGTGDIDIWVEKSSKNAQKISAALEEFGAPITDEGIFEIEQNILQIGVAPNRIDIITSVDGLEFSKAWKQKERLEYEKISISVLSLDDIITNKLSTGREKDILDAKKLQKIKDKKG